jgi:hypothetical protein
MKFINRVFYKIEKFVDNLESLPRRFVRRTNKLIDFIKLGWEDYDWDYGYTYELLHYKFKKQAEYFEKSGLVEGSDYMAKVCRVLYKSIERFEEKGDFDFFSKYMEKKLPFKTDWKFVPSDRPGFSTTIWVYEGTDIPISTADAELKSKMIRRAANFEQRMKKKYRKIFYKTMYKNMEKLWD